MADYMWGFGICYRVDLRRLKFVFLQICLLRLSIDLGNF